MLFVCNILFSILILCLYVDELYSLFLYLLFWLSSCICLILQPTYLIFFHIFFCCSQIISNYLRIWVRLLLFVEVFVTVSFYKNISLVLLFTLQDSWYMSAINSKRGWVCFLVEFFSQLQNSAFNSFLLSLCFPSLSTHFSRYVIDISLLHYLYNSSLGKLSIYRLYLLLSPIFAVKSISNSAKPTTVNDRST